jgi:colanic acid/amylovoran biosynthesis glycosyltransferase
MNIAIFSPSQKPYSETFIQAHKNYLADNVSYYYGLYNAIKLENGTIGFSKKESYIQAFKKHVLNINLGNLQHKAIIKSLRKEEIDVILVE